MAVGYKSGSRALGAFLNSKVSTNVIGLYNKSSEDSELLGASENRGPEYRTLNSRILIIRSPE